MKTYDIAVTKMRELSLVVEIEADTVEEAQLQALELAKQQLPRAWEWDDEGPEPTAQVLAELGDDLEEVRGGQDADTT